MRPHVLDLSRLQLSHELPHISMQTAGHLTQISLHEHASLPRRGLRRTCRAVLLGFAQVGLTHVSSVIVGSPMKKGISGGERKRLCVAMELLTKPKLLFLVSTETPSD